MPLTAFLLDTARRFPQMQSVQRVVQVAVQRDVHRPAQLAVQRAVQHFLLMRHNYIHKLITKRNTTTTFFFLEARPQVETEGMPPPSASRRGYQKRRFSKNDWKRPRLENCQGLLWRTRKCHPSFSFSYY